MLVKRISPAPNDSTVFAQVTASKSTGIRPPLIKTFHLFAETFLASIATTMH